MYKIPEDYKGILIEKGSLYVQKIAAILGEDMDRRILSFLAIAVLSLGLLYFFVASAPSSFPEQNIATIEDGKSIASAARQLKEDNIIRSKLVFKTLVVLKNGNRGVIAGDYYFHQREGLFTIVKMVTLGKFGLDPVRITIFEGATREEMAISYTNKFDKFNAENFLRITKNKEGYLFPDTYFFLPNVRAREVAKTMEDNFYEKIADIQDDLDAFGETLEDVVIMASLLEKEASLYDTRQIIAGILWKRIDIGMPLQVDAVFLYINGKNTFQLSTEDLKIDSPYNTYLYKGLPVGPIANPGLRSLKAAVNPIETEYFFYLSDTEGVMHYAKTFDLHKRNKTRYLSR